MGMVQGVEKGESVVMSSGIGMSTYLVSPFEGKPTRSRGSVGAGRRRDHAAEGGRRAVGRLGVCIVIVSRRI